MKIEIEISPGELADRFSILDIKRDRIAEPAKLANVEREVGALWTPFQRAGLFLDGARCPLFATLRAVNERLWDVEDALRGHERRKDFGPEFIELARSVYRLNDERARLKRQINEEIGSSIVEEKSYAAY